MVIENQEPAKSRGFSLSRWGLLDNDRFRERLFQKIVVFSPLRAIRSICSICNAFYKEVFRHYPMFRHRSATPAGVTGNGEVRSPGDNVTSILGSAVDVRADTATGSITAVGG
jgi:hypothetical protein